MIGGKYIMINYTNNINFVLFATKGKEGFYEKFGFDKRPNEQFGCGMAQ